MSDNKTEQTTDPLNTTLLHNVPALFADKFTSYIHKPACCCASESTRSERQGTRHLLVDFKGSTIYTPAVFHSDLASCLACIAIHKPVGFCASGNRVTTWPLW